MKKGRISKKERSYIEKNLDKLTSFEIAEVLNRDPNSVEEYIKREFKFGMSDEEEASFDLKDRPYWPVIQSQFTDNELEIFDYHWSALITQFKKDVIHSEEMQIVDLVKFDLLMNRSLSSQKSNLEQIRVYEALISEERAVDPDQIDRDKLFNLEKQVASLRASTESLGKDYRDLQEKKNKILKDMKATREQRSKHLEDKNQTWKGWIKYMIENPDEVSDWGMEMEKRRLAMNKELDRLSKYHTFEDGVVDQPFLNADTLLEDDK